MKLDNKYVLYLACICLLTILVYLPSLKGGFVLDDFHNLAEMTKYGNLNHWESAKQFIFSGNAGPTGRPISLASFAITASSWPHEPYIFKIINLLIHLLCGIFLYLVTTKVLKLYGYSETKIASIALLSCAIWMLHPFMVSTTAYVIQRMTQLAALFTFMGIWAYLYSRSYLVLNQSKAYLMMSMSVICFTMLATFSKENGVLLPFLLLVIEFCNPNRITKIGWKWKIVFLILPSLIIIGYLLSRLNFSENLWIIRNFNQVERLLTEPRVLFDYLYHLYIPKFEGNGLYQDGYRVSKTLFEPISTILSIVGLLLMLVVSIIYKKKIPLLSLGVLFFLVSHLIESTVVGIELYFEHRNYSSSAFLFLGIAALIFKIKEHYSIRAYQRVVGIILVVLCFFTYHRSVLWSNTENLRLYWSQENPYSPRAQIELAHYYLKQNDAKKSIYILEKALEKRPDSSLLSIRLLRHKIDAGIITVSDYQWLAEIITSQRPEWQAIEDLKLLVRQTIANPVLRVQFSDDMINVLDVMMEKSKFKFLRNFNQIAEYEKGILYLASQKNERAVETFEKSYVKYKNIDLGLSMVGELIAYQQIESARSFLKYTMNVEELQLSKKQEEAFFILINHIYQHDQGKNYD